MRRHKQELSRDECIDILTNEPRGVLALLGDYDYPYALPMSHVYVDGKIYFHGAMEGHKNDAVEKYDKVSYCVMDKGVKNRDGWSYIFKSVKKKKKSGLSLIMQKRLTSLHIWEISFSQPMRIPLMKFQDFWIELRSSR